MNSKSLNNTTFTNLAPQLRSSVTSQRSCNIGHHLPVQLQQRTATRSDDEAVLNRLAFYSPFAGKRTHVDNLSANICALRMPLPITSCNLYERIPITKIIRNRDLSVCQPEGWKKAFQKLPPAPISYVPTSANGL